MYLKNLTVLGFKSFADKTSLNFLPGVTAIVGPNGCGKSNVSDAIRWVLGEQSAKALRGSEMADVIFTGTDKRKPLGLAEVSLTLGDVDEEQLRAAGVDMSYNEITVTRRVFRDGGSEYFINKTPCRLKDIQQLFMGTGVGRTSYSIMAQGNITQLLSSKPEDRRMVFEEAAGITKFKAQKKEALRKLEYTEQNLLRVSDLIREVKRQIGSLQRQAGKARRYKQFMSELQHLDTQLARHQFDVLQGEIRERHEQVEQLRDALEQGKSAILQTEDEVLQLRERLGELDHQISESQQRGMELRSQIEKQEHRIQFNEQRLREIETQNASALAEITQCDERRLAAEQELESVKQRLEESRVKVEQQRGQLEEKREALRGVEQQLMARQEELRQAQSAAFAAAQELTRLRNELTALDLQKRGNQVRLEKLSSEKIQLEEERVRLEARLGEFSQAMQVETLNVETRRGTVEERQSRLKQLHVDLGEATKSLDDLLRQQAERRSKLNVLTDLDSAHEGFSEGTLAALKGASGVLGSLADKIRVPDEYVPAIEAALGHHLQLVLTEQPETAEQILADLRNNRRGKASIAALGLQQRAAGSLPATESGSEAGGQDGPHTLEVGQDVQHTLIAAASIIEAEEAVRPLLAALLGSTRIAPDLAAATAAYRESNGAFDFVTLTGELLTRHGVFTGGSANGNGKGSASILARKNQIDVLKNELAALQTQVEEASRRKGGVQSEQTELQAGLQQAQTELRQTEVTIATRQGELRALEQSQRTLNQKIETVVYEIQSLAEQDREGNQKREEMSQRLSELETREKAATDRVAELSTGLDGLREQREAANAVLTEAKVAFAAEEQMLASLQRQQGPLEQRIRELGHQAEQRRKEAEDCLGRKAHSEAEIADARTQIERLQHDREQVSAQTALLVGQRDERQGVISEREEKLRAERESLNQVQQRRSQLEVELAQKDMAVQNLRQRIQEKYQLNLDDIRSECITITYADEGPARVQTVSPEELAQAGVATDWNAVAEQVAALQKRIEEMGPVNVVAIEEYEEAEERHNFLTTQNDDLTNAKTELMEVLNRINTQTREMFVTTFNQIRENFQVLFTEIFGGGKADLHLADDGDVLESGIDIVARPPGKQLQGISLLSGGEQTMTAVALLFAIYQVKPSPFCVLDELDAPLDESNINRFVRVLQRFLEQSQFIIITHNKRTIGMADVLYGVTMQEQGVSRIVSVKFHKADETVTDHQPKELVPKAEGQEQMEAIEDTAHKAEETMEIALAK
jgi:chromosome segregation protein